MRLAVIDCGTNTFNLLVVETAGGSFKKTVFNTRVSVKLGQDSINRGFIGEAALGRAEEALQLFYKHLKELDVTQTIAYATSAIRDASNGAAFVTHIKQTLGIELRVIDGDREADLIYRGVRTAVQLNATPSLIMDIGGGSTEFIIANSERILWKHSYNLGAARLLERFKPSDPLTDNERRAIFDYLNEETKDLQAVRNQFDLTELVGSSGAFDSIIEMIHGEFGGEALLPQKTEYTVNNEHLQDIIRLVLNSTLAQRKQIKGLVPMRFDMIVISCLMIQFIMTRLTLSTLRVSTYSLKEGALAELLTKNE